jgi:hypothetical protein
LEESQSECRHVSQGLKNLRCGFPKEIPTVLIALFQNAKSILVKTLSVGRSIFSIVISDKNISSKEAADLFLFAYTPIERKRSIESCQLSACSNQEKDSKRNS